MKRTLSQIVLLFAVAVGFAIQPVRAQNLDSLKAALLRPMSDSSRITLLDTLADLSLSIDINSAKDYAEQIVAIAEHNKLDWGYTKGYRLLGTIHSIRGDYLSAAKYDNYHLSHVLSLNDSSEITVAFTNLGDDYLRLGEYEEAYYNFINAFEYARIRNDSSRLGMAILNLGSVFKGLDQYELALSHMEISRKINLKRNNNYGYAHSLDEIGDVYLRTKNYEKAEAILLESFAIAKKYDVHALKTITPLKISRLYEEIGEHALSLSYLDTTEIYCAQYNNELGRTQVALGRGRVFLAQNKFDQAKTLIQNSLLGSRRLNARIQEIEGNLLLSSLYEKTGDAQQALAYLKTYKSLRDSLYTQKMVGKLYQDQLRFAGELKDRQIDFLNKERLEQDSEIKRREIVNNILVVLVALTFVLLYTVYRSGQRRKKINRLLNEHQGVLKTQRHELQQLNQVKDKFLSIVAHDLRSPINSLSAILDLLDRRHISPEEFDRLNKELRIQLNHTKSMMNNLLHWALLQMEKMNIKVEEINLHMQIEENILLLQSLHLKNIDVKNEVAENSKVLADSNMLNLILRNLILNSIKFTNPGGQIVVSAIQNGKDYTISVSDNGMGIDKDIQKMLFEKTMNFSTSGTASERGTGLGLILCKEFVEKHGGKIWLNSETGKGSTFYFTLQKA